MKQLTITGKSVGPTETQIRRQVESYMRFKGWFVFYILQGMGAYKGVPDLIAAKNGETIALEIKRPGGRQSDHQKRFQANYEAAGCKYIIARGIEDLEEKGF